MLSFARSVLIGVAVLAAAPTSGREACQERVLSLHFSPQASRARYWCWAASGHMVMELMGAEPNEVCQCRQAQQVLGVEGCCVTPSSCVRRRLGRPRPLGRLLRHPPEAGGTLGPSLS